LRFSDINALVGRVPFISKANAGYLYELILRERPIKILELGIAHGTSTCYMAAALQEIGAGTITAVDLIETADRFQPTPANQLELAGLSQFVEIVRMKTGYSWFLHDKIRENTNDGICAEEYDLCLIDGPKNWTIDGAAFFFVDKLLKPGGWIIFDDYSWTYARADTKRAATDGITHRTLSDAERETPHIREVFELLVVQHPNYSNFVRLNSDWALAQKVRRTPEQDASAPRHQERHSYRDTIASLYRKLNRIKNAY
jgi:predicted O-methyltransferase YrrM